MPRIKQAVSAAVHLKVKFIKKIQMSTQFTHSLIVSNESRQRPFFEAIYNLFELRFIVFIVFKFIAIASPFNSEKKRLDNFVYA